MRADHLQYQFKTAPSLKLLRYEHGAIVAGFLYAAFKQVNRLQVPYHELVQGLEQYVNGLDDETAASFTASARYYIDQWGSDGFRFIRKYYEAASDEPITELTHDTEQALEWLVSLEKREFVGARSRFYAIFENLGVIAVQGRADPTERLAHLERERANIEQEIRSIKRTGKVSSLDRVEVKERFLNIMDDARRLIADFRLIEDIFKDQTRRIKEQKLRATSSKGAIVGQVLDLHDYLEESDQGKSFRSFWSFLMSETKQAELKELTAKVLALDGIREITDQATHRGLPDNLLTLKSQLLQVGHKVLASQSRLSRELRKLLHQDALAENKKVNQEIFEIKRLCLLERDALGSRWGLTVGELDLFPDVRLPLERPLWRSKEDVAFAPTSDAVRPGRDDDAALGGDILRASALAVRPGELEERIEAVLKDRESATLAQVLAAHPVSKGCAELVAYLAIATAEARHRVDAATFDQVAIGAGGVVRMPRLVFGRRAAAGRRIGKETRI